MVGAAREGGPRSLGDVRARVIERSRHVGPAVTEEAGFLPDGEGARFSVLIRPSDDPPARTAVVVCHSWFELRMLQGAEFAFLRSAAEAGFAGRYIQAVGAGDSPGPVEACTLTERVAAARAAAHQLLEELPEVEQVAYFGARLGGAVALMAAASEERSSAVIAWDPALRAQEYWKQSRRFARVVGALGRRAVEDHDAALAAGRGTTLVGYEVTRALRADLDRLDGLLGGRLAADVGYVVALNDALLTSLRRDVGRFVDDVQGTGLGIPRPRHLIRLRIEDAHRAIDPTVDWMDRTLR